MDLKTILPYSVAMITPFGEDERIDENGIVRMLEYYKANHVPALLLSGSTGEQHSLSVEERIHLYRTVKRAAHNNFSLYAGVAAVRTRDAAKLAWEAEQAGIDAIMLGFPPYVRPNQREASLYVESVCSATSLPIMLYNNPIRTGFNLEPDTLIGLVDRFPQIVALKETGDSSQAQRIRTLLGDKFQLFSGFDLTIVDYFKKGYDGLTSVAGNLYPNEMNAIVTHLREGQHELANTELKQLQPIMEKIGQIGWIRVIRHLFAEQGLIKPACREPLTPLTLEEVDLLKEIEY
ncbi:dihydrodipicolinate synthase family protein [Paenibacillus sp. YIM B09110]|uniref:dihydrodipicolinate synthase family protein n=1 Tax=Paenibacillus sp. YIM B09110 TaxID=3126102 RepID=UPI00301E4145